MAERQVIYRVAGLEVLPRERQVLRDGQPIGLGNRAFDLLLALLEADGELVGKEALLDRVWPGLAVEEGNLHTQVSTLRKALAGHAGLASVPGRGYRLVGEVERLDAARRPINALPAARHDEASIAVLPFQNLGDDPEQGYFADGMAEELITALSRMQFLRVIARNSSFMFRDRNTDLASVAGLLRVRYVVGGSVRRAGGRIRIACHLMDAPAGRQIWSDRFDGEAGDVFALQDRVTASIVGAIEPRLHGAEVARAHAKPTADLVAYDLYLRALGWLVPRTDANLGRALEALDAAIELDPGFALALVLAAHTRLIRVMQGWTPATDEAYAGMVALAEAGLERGRDHPRILAHAAYVLAICGKSLNASLHLAQIANRLNPSSAFGLYVEGYMLLQTSRPDEALEFFARAMALSPLDTFAIASAMAATAQAHLVAARYTEAVLWAERAVREAPDSMYSLRILAAALAFDGRAEEAAAAARAATQDRMMLRLPIAHAAASRRLAEGLRLAMAGAAATT